MKLTKRNSGRYQTTDLKGQTWEIELMHEGSMNGLWLISCVDRQGYEEVFNTKRSAVSYLNEHHSF
tara:strand:+ start:2331 stop:2528 length:198 start_codon:yes stop_codon:yes gene_type:complete